MHMSEIIRLRISRVLVSSLNTLVVGCSAAVQSRENFIPTLLKTTGSSMK